MSTRAKYIRQKHAEDKNEPLLETDIVMRYSNNYGKYVGRALTLFFG